MKDKYMTKRFICNKCGYKWKGKKNLKHLPKACPNCKVRTWFKLSQAELTKLLFKSQLY